MNLQAKSCFVVIVKGTFTIPKPSEVIDVIEVIEARADNERVVLSAEREIELRCGKSSITLTKSGKVIIRGFKGESQSAPRTSVGLMWKQSISESTLISMAWL